MCSSQFWQLCVLNWWDEDEKLDELCALLTSAVCLLSSLSFSYCALIHLSWIANQMDSYNRHRHHRFNIELAVKGHIAIAIYNAVITIAI